ncbi:hypothetical protein Val02_19600 [Virgisporangium aliadipatigenens]|uniref:WD40 repeat domain-containing protein n=1 Tax=Virgisporangium aliadipatigenens TaxID=741659 RepID=A0A8J3YGY4_9ACTN|nr:hypothetical protein Val02_19600 [Virgisporangium aliadipatigenens]
MGAPGSGRSALLEHECGPGVVRLRDLTFEEVAAAAREGGARLTLDSLDETADARRVVSTVVHPAVRAGRRVIVATDRDGADLFGRHTLRIDLADPRYGSVAELTRFTRMIMKRAGHPTESAARVATLAEGNYLVAALYARIGGEPATPALDAAITVWSDALAEPTRRALTALAYARVPGFTVAQWHAVARALGTELAPKDLRAIARAEAPLLVTRHADRYLLAPEALANALRRGPADEAAVATALLRTSYRTDVYTGRNLPVHAAAGGMLDDVYAHDPALLQVDLGRLDGQSGRLARRAARERARLVRLTPGAATAGPAERAAMFAVTAAVEGLHPSWVPDAAPAYRVLRYAVGARRRTAPISASDWVTAVCGIRVGRRHFTVYGCQDGRILIPGAERVLHGHERAVRDLFAVPRDNGRALLASRGADATLRLWEPDTGEQRTVVPLELRAPMCVAAVAGRLLVADGHEGGLRIRDADTGDVMRLLDSGFVTAMCTVPDGRRTLVATATRGVGLTLLDPATARVRRLPVPDLDDLGEVTHLLAVPTPGGTVLAVANRDSGLVLVDLATGRTRSCPTGGHDRWGLAALRVGGRHLLVYGGLHDPTVWLVDPPTGRQVWAVLGDRNDGPRRTVPTAAGDLLAQVSAGGTVSLWSPSDLGNPPDCPMWTVGSAHALDGSPFVTGGDALRVWTCRTERRTVRPATEAGPADDRPVGVPMVHDGRPVLVDTAAGVRWTFGERGDAPTTAVCAAWDERGSALIAAGADGRITRWDPATGQRVRPKGWLPSRRWQGPDAPVTAMCALRLGSGRAAVTTVAGSEARVWDLRTGRTLRSWSERTAVTALCAMPVGSEAVAVAQADGTLTVRSAADARELHRVRTAHGTVRAMCLANHAGAQVLATTGDDGTVVLWSPILAGPLLTVPVRRAGRALAATADGLVVITAGGVLELGLP